MYDNLTSDAVKAKARGLGFDLCGVAPVGAFPELAALRDWLDRGYAGDMAYMARTADRRADVRAVMPSARSVVALGTLYNTDRPYSTEIAEPGAALISRYAWGDDYHDVLGERTRALAAWMREAQGGPCETRVYVDTGPVQERVYARYAGLGWIGKNTCLINPDLGSWLFLSEVLCSAALEPDAPALDQCGACTLCLEACPTGALPAPGVLDSTRCLSYLTIETKGPIPPGQRADLGAHVYGCDICQDVCPYNAVAPVSGDPAWQARPALDRPSLAGLWSRSDAELRQAIRKGPMTRARVKRLRRNVAVAMGNRGAADARAALAPARCEARADADSIRDPLVAEHMDWARAELERRRGHDGAGGGDERPGPTPTRSATR